MRERESRFLNVILLCVAALATVVAQARPAAPLHESGQERHLANIRQLTHGGENAEAYFSSDGSRLIYQSTRPDYPCDQIYSMKIDGTDSMRVSTGTGRTTCGYFYPNGRHLLFASTHETSRDCPPRPSFARGYVWPVYPGYDIYRADLDGWQRHAADANARLRRRSDHRCRTDSSCSRASATATWRSTR